MYATWARSSPISGLVEWASLVAGLPARIAAFHAPASRDDWLQLGTQFATDNKQSLFYGFCGLVLFRALGGRGK